MRLIDAHKKQRNQKGGDDIDENQIDGDQVPGEQRIVQMQQIRPIAVLDQNPHRDQGDQVDRDGNRGAGPAQEDRGHNAEGEKVFPGCQEGTEIQDERDPQKIDQDTSDGGANLKTRFGAEKKKQAPQIPRHGRDGHEPIFIFDIAGHA